MKKSKQPHSVKVSAETVISFFSELKGLMDGIVETIRFGDDGMENCVIRQVVDIIDTLRVFYTQNLSGSSRRQERPGLLYNIVADKIVQRNAVGLLPHENVAFFQHRLYCFIKRNLRAKNLSEVRSADLFAFIDAEIIARSDFEKAACSLEWAAPAQRVIDDIINEIVCERTAHPQLALFSDIIESKPTTLLDILASNEK